MKSKFYTIVFGVGCLLASNVIYAQWQPVGSVAFSAGQVNYTSTAVDKNGTPYIAYQDLNNGDGVTVQKFNGTSWVVVGSTNLSNGPATFISLAIDSASGTPYVAYQDSIYYASVTVQKFNGTNWVVLDSAGLTGNETDYVGLAVSGNGTPYIVFEDWTNNFKTTVMQFNGAHWATVGTPGFSAGEAEYQYIGVDHSGAIYVAYKDDNTTNNSITVNKFNGANWIAVGSTGFSGNGVESISLAFDSANTVYAAYGDFGATPTWGASVMKYAGGNWVQVGAQGFSPGEADYPFITISEHGAPVVIFSDEANAQKASVMAFNGTGWVNVGNADFSSSQADYTTIVADHNGNLYAGYVDYGNSHTTTVEKFAVATGIDEANNISALQVYPNPNNGVFQLHLQTSGPEQIQLTLFDVLGQRVWQQNVGEVSGEYNSAINILNGAPGIYILQVNTDSNTQNIKLQVK